MNFRHPWYPVVFALEQRFGGLSIPGLIRYLSVFQLLVIILENARPGYLQYLTFDWVEIQSYQLWRLFSFMFVSGPSESFFVEGGRGPSILFGIIVMFIMWFISDVLEEAWGSYKVNLFVLSTVFFQMLILLGAALLLKVDSRSTEIMSLFCGRFLYCSIFMATAAYAPNYEFRLAFVIPVKLKWLALVVFAMALWTAMDLGTLGLMLFTASIFPFALVFLPQFAHRFKHGQEVAARRRKFATQQMPDDDVFHRCAECGVTDQQDPEMDFRVAADDKEYCRNCLPEEAKKGG